MPFRRTSNRVFEAVCDDFIWIEEPKDEYSQTKETIEFTDLILIEYARQFKPTSVKGEDIIKEAAQILNYFTINRNASYILKNSGLNISIFSQALSYRIKDFNYTTLGFKKFVDFIRYVSREGKIKLIHNPPSDYRLLYHDSSVEGFVDVEPLTHLGEIHTTENYKFLLSKGSPIFPLPSYQIVFSLATHLSKHKSKYQSLLLGDIVDNLGSEYAYPHQDIKNCIISLVSAGCFLREPEDAKLSEQRFSFIYQSPEDTISILKHSIYQKIQTLLGNVKDEIFEGLFS